MLYNTPGADTFIPDLEPCRFMPVTMKRFAKTFHTTIPQLSSPGVLKLKDRAVTRYSYDRVDTIRGICEFLSGTFILGGIFKAAITVGNNARENQAEIPGIGCGEDPNYQNQSRHTSSERATGQCLFGDPSYMNCEEIIERCSVLGSMKRRGELGKAIAGICARFDHGISSRCGGISPAQSRTSTRNCGKN